MHTRCFRAAGALLALILLLLANAGVGCIPPGPGTGTVDGNTGVDPNAFPGRKVAGEPNDDFSDPIEILFSESGQAMLQGTISSRRDVDVYSLGPLKAGDRIIVDVGHLTASLDSAIAIFDAEGKIVYDNDDRSGDLGQLNPFLNAVIRHDSPLYYLAISSAPLGPSSGAYEINISRVLGGAPPAPVGQTIILNFGGGSITVSGDRTYTVGPFDTADIDPVYTGLTALVEAKIVQTVKKDFEGLNVNVLVSPPFAIPGDCSASVVYFGGSNPNAFGTSQQVDPYNADPCDASIIFTEMFIPERFGRVLSGDELGLAIGNIATHEVGHLLGLNHVADITDVMDTTGGPSTFLIDQQFKTAPLDGTIFPIGEQDGFLLLLETLGALGQPL